MKEDAQSLEGNVYCVLGSHGFIGSSLVAEIKRRGGLVTTTPTEECKAVFHFASYTHLPFEKNVAYHTQELVDSLLYLFPFCKRYQIPLIYPSSALVYESPRPFYHFKKMVEEMQYIYNAKSVALRIFPVYGVGEGDRGHTTAVYQWVREMMKGHRPKVFGNGYQKRAFTYIDDVIDAILVSVGLANTSEAPIVRDIGSPEMLEFNEIIGLINKQFGTHLLPVYEDSPAGYAKGVVCPDPLVAYTPMKEGIARIVEELKNK